MSEQTLEDHGQDQTTYGIDSDVFQYLENMAKPSSRGRSSEQRTLAIMLELVKFDRATFLLLKDDDVGKWWSKQVSSAVERVSTWKRQNKDYQIKIAVYNRLSASERRALGIRKPTKPVSLGLEDDLFD
jgi:hypothetical protein